MKKIFASLVLLIGISSAHAVVLDTFAANGNTVDNSFSTSNMFSPEIGLSNTLPITFNLILEANDGATLSFNSILKNFIGYGIQQLSFSLSGASFASVGSAAGNFGSLATVSGDANSAVVDFLPPEFLEATVGEWFLDGSGTDWHIDLANLSAGDRFSLTIAAAVPEPSHRGLILTGVGLMLLAARRRNS